MPELPAPKSTSRYLDGRITTASQPELQLMLLEGALRFARRAQQLWNEQASEGEVSQLLTRTVDVVEELVCSVTRGSGAAAKRLEEEYAFALRRLAAAQFNRDAALLDEAVRLLAYHAETWKLACEKLKATSPPVAAQLSSSSPQISTAGGFSLQA